MTVKKKGTQIAIDGPVAAGKSSVAKGVAKKLGYVYIDTGAMYRAVALYMESMGVSWENESAVSENVSNAKIRLAKPVGKKDDGRPVSVYLGSEDVSWEIRNSHIAEGASVMGKYPKVRKELVKQQQKMAQGESVVMEGRDICLRVLPKAEFKIFMTADVGKRVLRKWEYLKERGINLTKAQVKDDLTRRDEREMNRKIDPLKPVRGAWVLDTSGMNIDEVIDTICERVKSI
ncbi:(d)CMP kinase [Patescibacteria group bacterium]